MQDASAVCPVVFPYVPALQSVQDVLPDPPVPTRYFPAPQIVQDSSVICPVVFPYFPAPQSVQVPLPTADLYFPDTHAVHVPPSRPDDPKLQVQEVKTELPVGALEFSGQEIHDEIAEDPIVAEYVPVPQLVQTKDPGDSEYVPDTQLLQSPDAFDVLYFPAAHLVQFPTSGPE